MDATVKNKKKPVILQVLPALNGGGVERGTIDIARAIKRAGGVAIVASNGGKMQSQLSHSGILHVNMPLTTKNPFRMWRNGVRLARLIRKHEVDIIHARSRAPGWSCRIASRRTHCPLVTTFHGTYGLKGFLKRPYNSVMVKGDRVIAVSRFIADHITKHYKMNKSSLRVIHRGVDLKLFNPFSHSAQRMIEISKSWRLPDEHPLILFPGRITRWKGQDVFIKALAKLPHRNFFAIILGDDIGHSSYRLELEKLISDLGLEGYVRIASHTPYISEAYMLAKVVVSTSLEPEAFGRVVLEAQAMGKAVIATNHGGPQETVVPEVTGWLIDPNNPEMLALFMDHALNLDDETLHWMAEQAVANARQFSLEAMCQHTLDVYAELLEPTKHSALLPVTSGASSPKASEHAA